VHVDSRQFVATRAAGPAATFGQRYIFAFVERSTLSARFRLTTHSRPASRWKPAPNRWR
jgi:hypothetical protein